ncbi:MAG: helix-hairpin-helix domain-containing protein [bacterium]|nr:helix-hairpin-helix domain-containing protein [bacterium]
MQYIKNILALIFLFFLWFLTIGVSAADRVEINTASLQQLDEIIGIGPALGQRIIDARPFSSLDDLVKVKGIGEKTLQKIKDQGIAYVAPQSSPLLVAEQTVQPIIKTATEPIIAINEPIKEASTEPVEVKPPPTYPKGIVFNEVLPSPEGADDTEEWIEVFNKNNFEVDLSGWKIQDIKGAITTYIFPKNTKITSQGYLVFKRPETKITLNNTEDGLSLLTPDEKSTDSLIYNNAVRSQSYNRTDSGWEWSNSLTPGSLNAVSQIQQKNTEDLSNLKKSDISNKNNEEIGTASIGNIKDIIKNRITDKTNPWFLFLTVLIIAAISGIIVLILKTKFQKIKKI